MQPDKFEAQLLRRLVDQPTSHLEAIVARAVLRATPSALVRHLDDGVFTSSTSFNQLLQSASFVWFRVFERPDPSSTLSADEPNQNEPDQALEIEWTEDSIINAINAVEQGVLTEPLAAGLLGQIIGLGGKLIERASYAAVLEDIGSIDKANYGVTPLWQSGAETPALVAWSVVQQRLNTGDEIQRDWALWYKNEPATFWEDGRGPTVASTAEEGSHSGWDTEEPNDEVVSLPGPYKIEVRGGRLRLSPLPAHPRNSLMRRRSGASSPMRYPR
jgi:hypothetical protein